MIPAVIIHLGMHLGVASLAESDEPLVTTVPALAVAAVMLAAAAVVKVLIRRGNQP